MPFKLVISGPNGGIHSRLNPQATEGLVTIYGMSPPWIISALA
jgi:hypothetical protein